MQAFGPPENDANTTGLGLIFRSSMSSLRSSEAKATALSGKNLQFKKPPKREREKSAIGREFDSINGGGKWE
jgi:hypothetical protein